MSSKRRHPPRAAGRLAPWAIVMVLAGGEAVVRAQEPGGLTRPSTRAEQIQQARNRKQAILWPEREGPLVARANDLLNRGLLEGFRSGEGANGWQFVFSGMRSGQGQTFGLGYRRSDLFRDALSARGTVRATLAGAVLVDFGAQLNRLRVSKETFVDFYTKYERSPRMRFYGLGSASSAENRTDYLLETVSGEIRTGYRFTPPAQRRVRLQRQSRAHRSGLARIGAVDRHDFRRDDCPWPLR